MEKYLNSFALGENFDFSMHLIFPCNHFYKPPNNGTDRPWNTTDPTL